MKYVNKNTAAPTVEVVAVSCVMTAPDLLSEMKNFDSIFGTSGCYPYILGGHARSIFRFGKPHLELLSMWNYLKEETGITFDLVYAAPAWCQILCDWKMNSEYWFDSNIIYLHCGGIEGNESQLQRYQHLISNL